MTAGQASLAWLCLLCLGLAAAFPVRLTLDERVTCFGAVDSLRTCNAELPSQELQQRCCIPFHALEGMDCFCDDDVAAEALTAMRGSAIGGLFACGLDTPFTAIYERQERCVAQAQAAEDALLLDIEEASDMDNNAALAEDTLLGTSDDWDSLFGLDSREDALDFLDDDIFDEQAQDAEDVMIEMDDDVIEIIVYADGLSEVVMTVPSDDMAVEIVVEAPETQELPALIAEGASDSSVTSLYDADFSDVNSMVGLISGWLGSALASAATRPNEDEATVGGLSQALAEILASLQATFAGTPLDVEISYEGGRDGALAQGDTEIDIEIDPELLPVMEPQFLDQRLLGLSQKWNGRAVRAAPGRIPEADLLELVQGLHKDPPSPANCFNSGICSWLCRHRRTLQYALGAETVLLVALFVLYARCNRRAQEAEELDADEESLRTPLIVSAADYADAPEKEPLWTLTTKVAIQHQ